MHIYLSSILCCVSFLISVPCFAEKAQRFEEYDFEQWETRAWRLADAEFLRKVKNVDCYKLSVTKYSEKIEFIFYNKQIKSIGDFKGSDRLCQSFFVAIDNAGAVLQSELWINMK